MELRQLAEDRLLDAAALLAAGRWSGAYYLAGYAGECGLKAYIMAYVENTGVIFADRKYAEKCWTHNLEALVELANLKSALVASITANPLLSINWGIAKDWTETSRYEQKTQAQAQTLYDSVTNNPNGVLPWIRIHW